MKHFLYSLPYMFMLATASLLVSCSANEGESEPEPAEGGVEMRFRSAELSRASVRSELAYDGSQFTVYGDMKKINQTSNSMVVFNGVAVTYRDSEWTYDDTQYWFPGYEFSFVGIHPAADTGISNTSYANSVLKFSYALPEDYKATTDLLAAAHRRQYSSGFVGTNSAKSSAVTMKFTHILAGVNFDVLCDGAADKIKITKIELEGVSKSGDYTIVPATLQTNSTQTDDYVVTCDASANKSTMSCDVDVEIADGEKKLLLPINSNALFVLPQKDNQTVITKITYLQLKENKAPREITMVAQTNIGGWEPGRIYTYSLVVDPIEVSITGLTVRDWEDSDDISISVPET